MKKENIILDKSQIIAYDYSKFYVEITEIINILNSIVKTTQSKNNSKFRIKHSKLKIKTDENYLYWQELYQPCQRIKKCCSHRAGIFHETRNSPTA